MVYVSDAVASSQDLSSCPRFLLVFWRMQAGVFQEMKSTLFVGTLYGKLCEYYICALPKILI